MQLYFTTDADDLKIKDADREYIIKREEERLMNIRGSSTPDEKKKIDELLSRLSDYKLSLRNRIGEL